MSQAVKYRELHLKIAENVTVIVDVASKADIKAALADLEDFGAVPRPKPVDKVGAQTEDFVPVTTEEDSPDARLEVRAGLEQGSLKKKNILAYKDGIPQLLRPSSFPSVSDAALTLIFSVEAGLKKPSVSFDDFKALYDAQNIKSGSPLSMLLNNLKNANYIDKGQYSHDRTIRLTAKGEKKATEVLHGVSK
ncbi:MAG: hypothetical protein HY038_03025 [Nitrospirae bacterium]|nr:hypothetical protein [Nitrospirota bacterium]